MMKVWNRAVFPFVSALALIALFALPAYADRMALWKIVHDKCVVHFAAGEGPAPCDVVDMTGGEEGGVALLKDLNGVAQMLAISTRRVTGIEDPAVLEPAASHYFAAAWAARAEVEAHLHRPLPRDAVSIAINSEFARSQDQLHLHVDCVDKDVAATLASQSSALDARFRPMAVELKGRRYWARRLDSTDLSEVSPFRLLADEIDGAKREMGLWSVAAIGAGFSGNPGFILLADRYESGRGGHAEDLQDHDCLITGPKS
jgi:CDP-diacylglycerol pyrophosphatase